MKLVDANVLLYAVNSSSRQHEEARTWLDGALNGSETIGFAWVAVLAFLRLATRAGIFPHPLTTDDAVQTAEQWLAQPPAVVPEPGRRHLDTLATLLTPFGGGGNLVSDAHLAALALQYDATIVTYDRDFGRFAGVSWTLPAAAD